MISIESGGLTFDGVTRLGTGTDLSRITPITVRWIPEGFLEIAGLRDDFGQDTVAVSVSADVFMDSCDAERLLIFAVVLPLLCDPLCYWLLKAASNETSGSFHRSERM
ncbi:hypothetical protein GCM10027416_19720 [Okibacterium endophyticum]